MPNHPELRVTKWLESTEEEYVKRVDFTTFLKKESPVYDKGRKTESEYKDVDTDELVVKKTFADTVDGEGKLDGIDITIEWYKDDNSVGLTKVVHKPLNFAEAENLLHSRRIKAIGYLVAAGKGTPVEPFMNAIFEHYKEEVQTWYDLGDSDVIGDAIHNETDTTIISYLGIVTDPVGAPDWDVRDGIYYQIDYTPPA